MAGFQVSINGRFWVSTEAVATTRAANHHEGICSGMYFVAQPFRAAIWRAIRSRPFGISSQAERAAASARPGLQGVRSRYRCSSLRRAGRRRRALPRRRAGRSEPCDKLSVLRVGAWLSGRASASHAGGRWFDSIRAHQTFLSVLADLQALEKWCGCSGSIKSIPSNATPSG